MEITLEDGRMTGAAPDGSVSPYGPYLCAKGLASVEFHNGAEGRLTGSLKRGVDGEFTAVAADAALDEIAAQLGELVSRHGPRGGAR